jgi:tetratricopeptide (TPR) repeat protein
MQHTKEEGTKQHSRLMKQLKIGAQLAEEYGEKVGAWQLRRLLTYIQIQSGTPGEALKELDKMWIAAVEDNNSSWQRFVWLRRGIAHAEMNSMDEAHKAANELKDLLEQAAKKKLMRDYHYLTGLIELKKKNYSGAIENLDKAQEYYDRITQLTVPRYFFSDCYVKSFYMLGQIFEQKGWAGKAIENYEKFLDFWKNANPGIIEVEDAKKKLAGLK